MEKHSDFCYRLIFPDDSGDWTVETLKKFNWRAKHKTKLDKPVAKAIDAQMQNLWESDHTAHADDCANCLNQACINAKESEGGLKTACRQCFLERKPCIRFIELVEGETGDEEKVAPVMVPLPAKFRRDAKPDTKRYYIDFNSVDEEGVWDTVKQ